MNQWTSSAVEPGIGAQPPWQTTRQQKQKKGHRTWLVIVLAAVLVIAFGLGFGAVYALNYYAPEFAYLFEKAENPTFTRPEEREIPHYEPVDPPMEQTPPDAPEDPVEIPEDAMPSTPYTPAPEPPSESASSSASGFTAQGDVVFPVLDAPRVVLSGRQGLRTMSVSQIHEAVSPSVTSVVAYMTENERGSYTLGTGTIYSSDGYIITNCHVVSDSLRVVVYLSDGTEYEAKHISSDETADIAILKIDAQGLQPVSFGRSSELKIGDEVTAIGCPASLDLAGTTTSGRITGPERYLPMDNAGNIMRLLQTDASVNPGNSGGPLINAYGQVVGIITAKLTAQTYEGIGFAISSDQLEHIVSDLLEYGFVTGYPMIGFTGMTVSEGKVDGKNPAGVQVAQISETGNAVGILEVGDVVFRVNGEAVYSIPDINAIKGRLVVGDAVHLSVYRDGEEFEADIILKDKHDVN